MSTAEDTSGNISLKLRLKLFKIIFLFLLPIVTIYLHIQDVSDDKKISTSKHKEKIDNDTSWFF